MIRFLIILTIFSLLSPKLPCAANAQEEITSFDRILIIAPHPDDEILAAGGVIQKAITKKATVKVVYITNGKHNLLSLFLRHKLLLKDKENVIELGKVRKKESIEACKILGLNENNLIFLGYPDSGILKIFLNHWGNQKPFKDSLSQLTYTEQEEGISFYASYKGENILKDLETVILNTNPTKVFIPSPYDTNEDHIGSYLFSRMALLSLEDIVPAEIYLYIVHRWYFSIFERHSYKTYTNLPQKMNAPNNSKILKLSQQEKSKKEKAILKFRTQMYCKKFLLSFVQDEIFNKELPPATLNNKQPITRNIKERNNTIARIILSLENNLLKGEIIFTKRMDTKDIKGEIYLFGYKRNIRFGEMPKTYLSFRKDRWNIYNQDKKMVKTENISFNINGNNRILFKVPIALLDDPNFIFVSMDISLSHQDIYLPWELIRIHKNPFKQQNNCLLYTSPSPRDLSTSSMPSSA